MVVSPSILIQVTLKMLSRYRVVDPINPTLHERPESLNRVRVNIPTYVDFGRVVNPVMVEPRLPQRVVGTHFIGINGGSRKHPLSDVWHQGSPARVGNRHGHDLAFPLHHAEHSLLASRTAPTEAFPLGGVHVDGFPAEVGLIKLYRAVQWFVRLFHQLVPNFLGDSPRRLVSHPKLSLKLLSGYPASSASHQVHGVQPQVQGRGRLVEDGSSGGMQVVTADGASPRLALLLRLVPFEGAYRLALRAIGVLAVRGVPTPPQRLQASLIIGVLLHEFHEGILRLRRMGSFRVFPIGWRHDLISLTEPSLAEKCYTVKG